MITGKSNDGGLFGFILGGQDRNSFWDIETSGKITSAGGTGKTTLEMKTKSTFADAGWNFVNIWNISPNVNDGYPYLNVLPNDIIEGSQPSSDISIYPNPVQNILTIDISIEKTSDASLTIYDINGNEVMTAYEGILKQGSNNLQINCEALPSGTFNIILQTDNKKLTKRFVVAR